VAFILFGKKFVDSFEPTTVTTTEITTTEATTWEITTEATTAEVTTTEATTAATEAETTEVTTEEESTEATTEEAASTYEVDYPGNYPYGLATQRFGDYTLGFIDVPSSWNVFQEAGGNWDNTLAHQQYSYGMADIITHATFNADLKGDDLKKTVESFRNNSVEGKVQSARFGTNTGYLLTENYGDGTVLRIFMFNDGKGHTQYLAVEGLPDDEYSDVYRLVFQNYSFEQ